MEKAVDHAYFTRKMFLRSVLASPLAAIGLALAEMGDTILVGHAIGMEGLAAIGYASPLFLLATFFVFGLSMGGAIVYSNLMHEGKKEEALGIFNFFFRISVIIGFGITIAGLLGDEILLDILGANPDEAHVYGMLKAYVFYILLGIPFEILMGVLTAYLRNDDADGLSVAIQGVSGVVNLGVSAILLFVFDWGTAGCSFGFFISNFLAVLVSLGYILFRKNGNLSFQWKTASLGDAAKPLRLGFATSSEYIFDALFTLVALHLLTNLSGTEGVAIFNIIENLSLLFIFLYELIGKTSQPLFSIFFAECNFVELHRTLKYALFYSLLWGVLATALVFFFPQIIELLFGLGDVEDVTLAYYAVQVFCIGTIFMGVALILQNYLQSEEDEAGAFLVVFLRRLGISLPLALVLTEFGFHAFWMVYPLSEILTLCVLYIYKKRKGERKNVEKERVYSASFLGRIEDVESQLGAIEEFALFWGADRKKCFDLRLTVEEICGIMEERATRKKDSHILTQLTLIAEEDGSFKLHLRDDGEELDPFKLSESPWKEIHEEDEKPDFRSLGLHVIKIHARQVIYRNYHGFNTTTITI